MRQVTRCCTLGRMGTGRDRRCQNCGATNRKLDRVRGSVMTPFTEKEFCIEVDFEGRVLSVEAGFIGDVPEELIHIAMDLAVDSGSHCAFIWSPDGSRTPCGVTIDVRPVGGGPGIATISGQYNYELPYGLTVRELDVLTILAVGKTNVDIADRLVLSTRTVTTHIDHVMRKMGVFSRTSAAVIAVDEGLIRVPFPGGDEGFDLLRLGRALRVETQRRTSAVPRRVRKPLIIGAALPLRGFAAADGMEMAQATQLAVDELNLRGGIDGRLLAMDIVDVDIMDADSIRRALTSLTEREVDVITSGYFAHQGVAHEIVADSGIPYLHAATMSAMEQRVRDNPTRYGRIFQVCPSDSNYAPRFIEVMSELRDRKQWAPSSDRLVVIQGAWDLTNLGVAEAATIADLNGWQLEVVRPFDDHEASWAVVADRIRRSEPAAVMIGHYLVEGTVSFLDQFLKAPSDTLLYSIYAPSVPEFRELMGELAEGIVWATVTGTYSDPLARAFVAKYNTRFNKNPGRSHAGIAYDRVKAMAQAWSQVSNPRDYTSVARELRGVIHRGVNGVYYFGGASQTALTYTGATADPSLAQAHLVFQIQGGHQRILSPAPYSDATFRAPLWLRRTHSTLSVR
jgi:branched-chain amino acid transport system substrate-binding protein